MIKQHAFVAALALAVIPTSASHAVPLYGVDVVATLPHDREAFTQGFLFHNGEFYESTGLHGASTIRRVRIEDGSVQQLRRLPTSQFGEGLALYNDTLFSLTWQNGLGYRWDRKAFTPTSTFSYAGEGWGLTSDGQNMIMSDGSATLRFIDPNSFETVRRLEITLAGKPLFRLNELEWVNGEILANIWLTPQIARIDPETGEVTGIIDLGYLAKTNKINPDAVLNGIAHDPATDRLWITGKYWPSVYQIKIVDPATHMRRSRPQPPVPEQDRPIATRAR